MTSMTSKHKRHKSDTVENHSNFYQPLINPSHQQFIDNNNNRLPQKIAGCYNVHHPRKEIKTA